MQWIYFLFFLNWGFSSIPHLSFGIRAVTLGSSGPHLHEPFLFKIIFWILLMALIITKESFWIHYVFSLGIWNRYDSMFSDVQPHFSINPFWYKTIFSSFSLGIWITFQRFYIQQLHFAINFFCRRYFFQVKNFLFFKTFLMGMH